LQSTREKSKNKRIGVGTVQTKKTSSHLHHYKILIVDDEPEVTQNGFSVDAFNDPLIALLKFKPAFYDLLLLDIKMPHLNGFQLYQEVKKKDNNARACFITAYEVFYDNLKEDYPTLDVGCFIKKPVEIDNLVKKIRKELNC
jgi:DNA-binding response OmpR family regulator